MSERPNTMFSKVPEYDPDIAKKQEKTIVIGTRGSRLALWQAHYTQRLLEEVGLRTELKIIKTKGDKIQHLSFDKIEGKGFFTKEIEDALLRGDIDMAVHSMKDMPTSSPDGLVLTAVSYRENPEDWLIVRKERAAKGPLHLAKGAIVGTSSARRKALMLDARPDVELKDIRGNVPTRLQKLRNGDFDAIVLAAAGIMRLDLDMEEFVVVPLNVREFVPAPAQGVLAFQTCEHDVTMRRILKKIHRPEVAEITNIERKVLKMLDAGCHTPLGAYCERDKQGNYHLWAAMSINWDKPMARVRLSSSTSHRLAERALEELQRELRTSSRA